MEIIRVASKALVPPDSVTSSYPRLSPVIQPGQQTVPRLLHGYGKPGLQSPHGALRSKNIDTSSVFSQCTSNDNNLSTL